MFEHKGFAYTAERWSSPCSVDGKLVRTKNRYKQQIISPDGEVISPPFHEFGLVSRDKFQLWVDLHIHAFDADHKGFRYRPARRNSWRYGKTRITHEVIDPDGNTSIAPFVVTTVVPTELFRFWIDYERPAPENFGRRWISMTLLRRLADIASQYNVPTADHDSLAVLLKLA